MNFRFLPLTCLLGLSLVGCHRGASTKMYSATAVIEIMPMMENEPEKVLAPEMENEIEAMESPTALLPIINHTNLIQAWSTRFKSGFDRFTVQEALDHLRQVLKCERIPRTTIIDITGYSEVPEEAADIANTVADQYKAMRDELQNDKALKERLRKLATETIREEIARCEKEMAVEQAAAKQNPHDLEALRKSQSYQNIIDEMNASLNKPVTDKKPEESRVQIISRAVPPPH